MARFTPLVPFRLSIPIGLTLATIANYIYYNNPFEYGPIGDFYAPIHLTNSNEEFQNNAHKNLAYSTELDQQSKTISVTPDRQHEATEAIRKIYDYTLKIQLPCSSGTAWILDYMKEEGKTYPTKWFIATNAHVINSFRFTSNKYKQVLPISLSETQNLQYRYGNDHRDLSPISGEACTRAKYYGYSGLNLFKEKSRSTLWDPNIYYKTIKDAKLFYAPINFLGSRYAQSGRAWRYDNYYKDFAILEIDFETENQAKIITDNFYGKYSQRNQKQLNMFDTELMSKKTIKDLDRSVTNYYTAGYPVIARGDYTRYTNYSELEGRASILFYGAPSIALKNAKGQPIRGHADSYAIDKKNGNTVTMWNGKPHYNWGYNYLLENMHMGGGASGSLVTDKQGNVLGLYRMQDIQNKLGFVEPLRSEGLYVNSKIILPKYDLIKGAPGQVSSYREQLEKYYPGKETFLNKSWADEYPKLRRV